MKLCPEVYICGYPSRLPTVTWRTVADDAFRDGLVFAQMPHPSAEAQSKGGRGQRCRIVHRPRRLRDNPRRKPSYCMSDA
jgi:hypothetical protein